MHVYLSLIDLKQVTDSAFYHLIFEMIVVLNENMHLKWLSRFTFCVIKQNIVLIVMLIAKIRESYPHFQLTHT